MLWLRSRKAGYPTLISPRALKTTFTTELGSTLNHAPANKVVWEGSSNPSYWSGVMVLQIMWDSYGWNENQEGRWLRLLGVRVFSCCGAPRGWFALQGLLINFCSNRPWIKKEIVMRACLLGYKVICSSVLDDAFAGFVVYMLMGRIALGDQFHGRKRGEKGVDFRLRWEGSLVFCFPSECIVTRILFYFFLSIFTIKYCDY